jgi:hypothetical protein
MLSRSIGTIILLGGKANQRKLDSMSESKQKVMMKLAYDNKVKDVYVIKLK